MKAFETPVVEVKKFDVEDVLTTSSATENTGPRPTETTTISMQHSPREGFCTGRADDWDPSLENCF